MNIRKYLLGVAAAAAGMLLISVKVFGAEQAFRVETSPDGKMWTVIQELPAERREDGTPAYWYKAGTNILTGKVSGIRALETGEHYYRYNRKGETPVGEWKVTDEHSYCLSGWTDNAEVGHGIVYGSRYGCESPYFSGWTAYCADCGSAILRGNIHMSYEAAKSINSLDVDKGYYFLCPCIVPVYNQKDSGEYEIMRYGRCGHLDKYWDPAPHRCREISRNRYRVVYDANGEAVDKTMEPSFHMYNNEEYFEGKRITPVRTLSLCTYDRTSEGYLFTGWNTRPDGTGDSYEDGEEIYNLSSENYLENTDAGTVTLYAQWKLVQSTLKIDAAGGAYQGDDTICRNWGSYWASDGSLLTPPSGYTAFFQSNGGKTETSYITGTRSFAGWELVKPANGELTGNVYHFIGSDASIDTIKAVYVLNPILLPVPVKDNYSFGGWYLDPDCTKLAGYGGDPYALTKNTVMYAKWVDLKLTAVPGNSGKEGSGDVRLNWGQKDGIGKVYRIYGKAEDQEEFEQIFVSEDERKEALTGQVFECEWTDRSFAVPSTGFYLLGANGAQGENYGKYTGGYGGSATGVFYLEKGEILRFTAGGQDGYNGGGGAAKFGKGGGRTIISSDQKGILLIAGGGGGATASRDGLPGGSKIGCKAEGDGKGGSGMAGGGGGCQGGDAGTRIEHAHTVKDGCYRDSSFDALSLPYAIAPVKKQWKDEERKADGTYVRSDRYFSVQIGSKGKLIPVNGNTSLELGAWIYAEGINTISGSTYIQAADQDGIPFFTATIGKLRQEWNQFETGTVLPSGKNAYAQWPPVANVAIHTTWSKNNPNGEYNILNKYDTYYPVFYENGTALAARVVLDPDYRNPVFYGNYAGEYYPPKDLWNSAILSHRGFGDRPLLFLERSFWYGTSGVHFKYNISIPKGTTGIYVYAEGLIDALQNHEGKKIMKPVKNCTAYFDRIFLSGSSVLDCRTADIDIPAQGGSSFINRDYALSWSSEEGGKKGNGSVFVRAETAGLTDARDMECVDAPDRAAPYAVDKSEVTMTAEGNNAAVVRFREVEDRGTRYFFKAESYSVLTGEKICDSNIAECTVMSGVKGYYYVIDTDEGTCLDISDGQEKYMLLPSEDRNIRVNPGETVQYLHIAAVDYAGNLSDTIHVEIDEKTMEVAWEISTDKIEVSSTVGETDYKNVYPAAGENAYYVRADGVSPFLLSFHSHLQGPARGDYQINHQIFDLRMDSQAQRYGTILPYSDSQSLEEVLQTSTFRFWSEGTGILADAFYAGAVRSGMARNLEHYRAFVMPAGQHGRTVAVVPVAGAAYERTVRYSDWNDDLSHAARLIGDGEGPVITGLEELENWRLIDREKGSIMLEVGAEDKLSGVRELYLIVKNRDNFLEEKYLPDKDGKIRVNLTGTEPVFSGDFTITVYAADQVGNETVKDNDLTEFGLTAKVTRLLEPHEPMFKRGESGVLSIEVWGYAEKVEIEFPEFLSQYNQTYEYGNAPQYKKTETIQFMIPLDALEDIYEITVRAYKGDRQLEAHPAISTMEVDGSVLDELRTRLR